MFQDVKFSLDDMIDPVSPAEFLEHYWEKKHLHISRGNAEHYGPMMKAEDIDRWLHLARRSRGRMGVVIPPSEQNPSGGYRATTPADASIAELYKAFDSGCSLALVDVQDYWLPLLPLTQALAEAFSSRISVNVYFTPAGKQGVFIHPDVTDVFVLQMEGAKEWFMFEPGYMLPAETVQHWAQLSGPHWQSIASYQGKS
ncbi:MAG: cupin domain-containing protein, partial [Acidobacteriota bacterium]